MRCETSAAVAAAASGAEIFVAAAGITAAGLVVTNTLYRRQQRKVLNDIENLEKVEAISGRDKAAWAKMTSFEGAMPSAPSSR